ncbi:AsmA family protein [Kushneria indalinina]|uniref:AsmA protein n=1 Tax=Kushneria indalinina DSM 14324 TaxID=1122140 RepID=A0A3D9DRX2_9GAMM|nr:AsmA family protein [Kushneria indalinina]REC93421.1 AsmA protein [Kushneria indalinina DSM 14324]
MKALFRIVLAAMGVLGLLAVAVVIYATTFLDPNDLKPRLADAVRERTGLELSLNGPLSWTFYPRIGVTVEDASARLPDQSDDDAPFAAFNQAEARLRFAPLLSGNIEVDGFTLDGLRLNLERDEQGRGNWETLIDTVAHQENAPAASTSRRPQRVTTAGERPLTMDVASVQVTDGRVHFDDRQHDREIALSSLALLASNVTSGDAFPLELSFAVESSQPEMTGNVSLKSQASLDLNDAVYTLNGLALKGAARLPALDSARDQNFSLNAPRLVADLNQQRYTFEKAAFDGALHLSSLGEPALPLGGEISGEVSLRDDHAVLTEFALSSGQLLRLTGSGEADQLSDDLHWQGQVEMAPADLRSWLERLGQLPATADAQALQRVGFSSRVEGDRHVARLTDLAIDVDGTALEGEASLGLEAPLLHADLEGSTLDLDRYLPPKATQPPQAEGTPQVRESETAQTTGQKASSSENARALARALDLALALRLEALRVRGIQLENVTLKAQGREGRYRLPELAAELYDGTLRASGTMNVAASSTALSFEPRLADVALQPLLRDALDRDNLFRGTLNARATLSSSFDNNASPLAHLDGKAAFEIADGAMMGINLPGQLCTTAAMLQGNSTSHEWGSDTGFDEFAATFDIVDGVIKNDDLKVALPGIDITGNGQIDLGAQNLDMALAARLVDTADTQGCPVSNTLSRIPLPLHCSGDLKDAPAQWCRFDTGAFRAILQKTAANEGQEKLREHLDRQLEGRLGQRIEEKLGEDSGSNLRNAIKGLFQ